MTKRRSRVFFRKKYGWYHQFAVPGDTHPSDATAERVPYLSASEVCSRRGARYKSTFTFTFTSTFILSHLTHPAWTPWQSGRLEEIADRGTTRPPTSPRRRLYPARCTSSQRVHHDVHTARAGLTIVSVVLWEGSSSPGGGPIDCQILPRCFERSV